MPKKASEDDLALLDDLGVDTAPAQRASRTPREERIIAGFEEIERFVEENGHLPQHGEENDIFERLYAVRLDRIRESEECRDVLQVLDSKGLLTDANEQTGECVVKEDVEEYSTKSSPDESILADLGIDESSEDGDITQIKHVKRREEIRAAEEVAKRTPCGDFAKFKPLFATVQRDLESGQRKTLKFKDSAEISQGEWFVLDGQKIIVAERSEEFTPEHGRPDRRLRVIFDNGTESDLLLRSLQRALNKDKQSRRITDPDLGPLFSSDDSDGDSPSGIIYVLRSLSPHPFVEENRKIIHKIGVTRKEIKERISNAKKEPTYLLADVEVVASYKLANLNCSKLEALLHHFFAKARLDLELKDRFGQGVEPREWFLVPLPVIQEAIEKLIAGNIEKFRYNPEEARIEKR